MDFFESQDAARRRRPAAWCFSSHWRSYRSSLSVYAVVVSAALAYATKEDADLAPELFLAVVVVTVAVVALGSLYKIAQLRGGGRVVAEALGGRLIPPTPPIRIRGRS